MKDEKTKLALKVLSVIFLMLILAISSVPLYNLFCSVTGWGGTTRKAELPNDEAGKRSIEVIFDSNQDNDLGIIFKSSQYAQKIKTGQAEIAYYTVENTSDDDIELIASYNVNPAKAGKYFNKINCFCFEKQIVKKGEKIQLPVYYFIDNDISNDKYLDDTDTIILSYVFHRYKGE